MTKAEKNIERVQKLIKTFPDDRYDRVQHMMDTKIGEYYFTAPASSRESHHCAWPGGLVEHSLNVVASLWRLAKDLCPDRWPKHKLAFVGLFHDLGKVGDGEVERYVPHPSQWHRERGNIYEINPEMPFMEHADGSIYILQKYGVTLDFDEYVAIRTHDGQYHPNNTSYKMREPDLSLLLHWSDMWSCKQEKKGGL